MYAQIFKFMLVGVLGLVFIGCDTPSFASEPPDISSPAVEKTKSPGPRRPGAHKVYTVKAGDSLERISRKQGLSQKKIARLNKIKPPYLLRIGQKIYIPKSPKSAQSRRPKKLLKTEKNSAKQTNREKTRKKIPNLEKTSRLSGNTQKSDSHRLPPDSNEGSGTRNTPKVFPATVNPWVWPLEGGVLEPYSDMNQGINIAGRFGGDVNAAAFGQVVHIGRHLINFGNLIIIKHNKAFFSAYGHIQNPQVKEGQWVEAGEKIAEIGKPTYRKTALHFEIRQNGEAIDPLTQLPKR